MFGFLKRNTKVNNEEIRSFNLGVKAIKTYINLSDWQTANKAIDEIYKKEKKSYENLINSIDIEKEKKKNSIIEKEKNNFLKKEKEILKLRDLLTLKKEKYNQKLEKQLFDIRFKKIRNEVDRLIGKKESLEAMNLLRRFLEENIGKEEVVKFFDKEKKKIQKVIDKQRKIEEEKIKQNTHYEAMCLIGDIDKKKETNEEKKGTFFSRIKEKFKSRKEIKENKESKKLLDEINLLLEVDNKINREIAEKRLENIHQGLVKEINQNSMIGYELYGKILATNKISGDSFGMEETKTDYKFYIGDATGHGIKAGFIVTLLNKLFNINYTKDFSDMVFDINNQLKQDLESRNFVTGIFFNIDKHNYRIKYIGMGHEPMLIFRKATKKIEKIIPGGLAIGIVNMQDQKLIKEKYIKLEDGDILMCYSDGLVEVKSIDGEFYGITKLEKAFALISEHESDVQKIYDYIINDVKLYRGGSNFSDDLTLILLKRDSENDLYKDGDKYVEKIKIKEGLNSSDLRGLKGKIRKEVLKEMEEIKKKKETKNIILNLENLYYTGEMLKLKEEATRYIKDGFIDKKINYYLKKAMENETKYKINLKNQKMQAKYNVLNELYKKGDYLTVIKEIEEIVSKDGNI